MQICKRCYVPMVGVMSFSKDKHERFSRCPNCYSETKHQKLKDNGLSFGEVLNRELHKIKHKGVTVNGNNFKSIL